ncbi:alpha/beta-hydrolase [Penicillium lagena]|uniref:alpha/beta-hydrolase n=1 Tax=Penicillium lagena TaxID=94218 RepID=UPI0025412693|nr:alpha/beta-hydrolase [Penicillium lagena]KAJ5624329.1 alpha/beta-hydrolase [Penicillium lagena]
MFSLDMDDNALYHTKLDTLFQGVRHPHSTASTPVTQFRGIKYASIPKRWRQSRLFEEYSDRYDATIYGPSCPQYASPVAAEDLFNGIDVNSMDAVKTEGPFQFNEFECLNLNISTPTDRSKRNNIPVMICIHGGGLLNGRNASWFVDGGAFVAKSVISRKPVIFVTLNYRLGSLGFLASKQLLQDNQEAGDAGVGNYGPHDIYLGIEWVYRNITAFGGDPRNITLLGESAGALGVLMQVYSSLPRRFRRAVVQSGQIDSGTMSYPATLEEQQSIYDQHQKMLGVNSLEEMRRLPVSEYESIPIQLQKLGSMICRITIDNIHYNSSWQESDCTGLEIIVGDTSHEYTVFEAIAREVSLGQDSNRTSTDNFIASLKDVIAEDRLQQVLATYSITPTLDNEEILLRLWQLIEDSTFAEPTERFASTSVRHGAVVYRYLFDEINPFGGWFVNRAANHALELPYLYGPNGIFSKVEDPLKEQKISTDLQEKWLRFAYGERIWKPFNEGGYYAFGPEGKFGQVDLDEVKIRRRVQRWEWVRVLRFEERWELVIRAVAYASRLLWNEAEKT